MQKLLRIHISGLIPVLIITGLAFGLNQWISVVGTVVWGLLLGLFSGNVKQWPEKWSPGIQFSEKTILAWAIIFMGCSTGAAFRSSMPWTAGILVVLVVVVSILSGLLLYRFFGLGKEDGILLGIGNAICGASAIAAASGVINASAKSTGTGIAIVNLLGIIGMFLIPSVLIIYPIGVLESALLTGGTLQAVGQAVAAGNTISTEVGVWATTIKLFRVSLLLPVMILLALLTKRSSQKSVSPVRVLPLFLWLFMATTLLGYFVELPERVNDVLKYTEKILLTIAMVGIGWQINLKGLKTEGPKRLLLGSVIFMIQLLSMILFIEIFHPSLN